MASMRARLERRAASSSGVWPGEKSPRARGPETRLPFGERAEGDAGAFPAVMEGVHPLRRMARSRSAPSE